MKRYFILLPLFFCACTGLPTKERQYGQILAHRGIHQTYHIKNLDKETCTAKQIDPPKHDFIENTIPSLLETIKLGGDIIEIDVHPTIDNDFVVFHDWTIDCRTNGNGVTRQQSMEYLRTLDVGYGYTADNGNSFPLRGKGLGLMVNLEEALSATGKTTILINIKSNDYQEGIKLADYLKQKNIAKEKVIIYGSGQKPLNAFTLNAPQYMVFSKEGMKECFKQYLQNAWRNASLEKCRNKVLFIPLSHRHMVYGYYNSLVAKLAKMNARVFITGKSKGIIPKRASGIDTIKELKYVPAGAGIFTNEIETIAPALKAKL